MHVKLDLFLTILFLLVQSRITVLLLRRSRRTAWRAAVAGFNALLLACYGLSFSEWVSRFSLDPRPCMPVRPVSGT